MLPKWGSREDFDLVVPGAERDVDRARDTVTLNLPGCHHFFLQFWMRNIPGSNLRFPMAFAQAVAQALPKAVFGAFGEVVFPITFQNPSPEQVVEERAANLL
jgi:hypothetical protein